MGSSYWIVEEFQMKELELFRQMNFQFKKSIHGLHDVGEHIDNRDKKEGKF